MVQTLAAEFGFTLSLAGLLTTGLFLSHALLQVPGGHMADRLGTHRMVLAGLAVVIIGNFAIASSTAYWHLLFWKVFAGVGTGTSIVSAARYVAEHHVGHRAHVAQGFYGGSILLGSGFVILAVPRLLEYAGWRGSFRATAAVAVAAWLLWLLAAPKSELTLHHQTVPFRELMADARLWRLGVMQMASFGLAIVIGTWIALYLRKTIGLQPVQAGLLGSTVLMLGMILRPLGGALVAKLGARTLLRASLGLTAAGCFLLAPGINALPLALTAIVLVGIGCGLPYAAIFTGAAALYPARAGAAMGLVNMLGIGMILVAPPVIGALVDFSGGFQSSFVCMGVFAAIALLLT